MDDISLLEAIEFARSRKVLLPSDYYKLDVATRRYAATVSQLATIDQIQTVLDAVHKTLKDGGTFNDFQKLVEAGDIKLSKNHLDNIFRTNIQNAYAHGRWQHQQSNKEKRQYLMYWAIEDSRTRPGHLKLHRIIRHIDDAFWKTFYPPNGYRCRCGVRAITEKQALRYGITPDDQLPDVSIIDKGWNFNPGEYDRHALKILESRMIREIGNQPVYDLLQAQQLELQLDMQADDAIVKAMPNIQPDLFEDVVSKTVSKGVEVRPSDLVMTIGLSDSDNSLTDLVKTSALQKDQDSSIGKRILDKIQRAFNRVFAIAKNTKSKLTGNSIHGLDGLNLLPGNIIGVVTPTLFKTAQNAGKNITILDAKGVAIDLSKISGLDGALLAPDLNLEVVSIDDNGLVLKRTNEDATRYFVANQTVFSLG